MYTIEFQASFVRDLKRYTRKGGNTSKVQAVLGMLRDGKPLSSSYRDHQLLGKLRRYRECHVEPDWLLVYEKDGKRLRIVCLWLVSHKKLRERERSV